MGSTQGLLQCPSPGISYPYTNDPVVLSQPEQGRHCNSGPIPLDTPVTFRIWLYYFLNYHYLIYGQPTFIIINLKCTV